MAEKLNRQLRQWSWWSRVLAATLAIFVALALTGYFRNSTTEARTNMRSILDAISNESAAVTNQYLGGPEIAAEVVAGMVREMGDDPELEQRLFTELISATPQVDAVYVGFPDGTFRFIARSDDPNATYRIRTIEGPPRLVTQSFVNEDLATVRSESLPENTYDPRLRPWYLAIASGAQTNWSDPYVFSSSKQLGVTYSVAVLSERNELLAVVGVDLTLDDLVGFLKERRPSAQGSAQVVNKSGLVLAGSATVIAEGEEDYVADTLPANMAALLNQTQGSASTFIDGDRWGNVRTVSGNGNWSLLVEAPESDFGAEQSGLVSRTSAAIALTSLLAFLLALAALRFVGQRVLRLNSMATFDDLTGLWNRAGTLRKLGQVLANRSGPHNVLVAILDLDRFKAVNDSHGHFVGDLTLQTAAHRIATIAEQYGMHCGRLGGDEFVLFGQPKSDSHVRMWGRIEHAVTSITEVGGATVDVGISTGVVVLPNSTPVNVTTALHLADRALYAAKRDGGNRTVVTSQVDGGNGSQVIDISAGERVHAGRV